MAAEDGISAPACFWSALQSDCSIRSLPQAADL